MDNLGRRGMIFTSRYQNPELRTGSYTVVRISLGAPRFQLGYKISGSIMDIAPPRWLFGENDHDVFTVKYRRNIEEIGVKRIQASLDAYLALGKDVVLCCYEDIRKPGETCHRRVFADWWKEMTGEEIGELPDPSEVAGIKKKTKPEKETPKGGQITLFDCL
jgi:hypothetical protein